LISVELLTSSSQIRTAKVNTILLAVGRDPNTKIFENINGLKLKASGKIEGKTSELEQTSVQGLYAIGDIVEGVPELMPVAQKSGKKLAH